VDDAIVVAVVMEMMMIMMMMMVVVVVVVVVVGGAVLLTKRKAWKIFLLESMDHDFEWCHNNTALHNTKQSKMPYNTRPRVEGGNRGLCCCCFYRWQ